MYIKKLIFLYLLSLSFIYANNCQDANCITQRAQWNQACNELFTINNETQENKKKYFEEIIDLIIESKYTKCGNPTCQETIDNKFNIIENYLLLTYSQNSNPEVQQALQNDAERRITAALNTAKEKACEDDLEDESGLRECYCKEYGCKEKKDAWNTFTEHACVNKLNSQDFDSFISLIKSHRYTGCRPCQKFINNKCAGLMLLFSDQGYLEGEYKEKFEHAEEEAFENFDGASIVAVPSTCCLQ